MQAIREVDQTGWSEPEKRAWAIFQADLEKHTQAIFAEFDRLHEEALQRRGRKEVDHAPDA